MNLWPFFLGICAGAGGTILFFIAIIMRKIAEEDKRGNFLMNIEEWAELSRAEKVCGMLGCMNSPVTRCPVCGNHYCKEHIQLHFHPKSEWDKLEAKP